MSKTRKFIEKSKLSTLEDGFGFLSNYKLDPTYDAYVVENSIENLELTKSLKRLGELNEERENLIKILSIK